MTDWIEIQVDAVRWLVHPAWRERLFDASGLRFAEWREAGLVATIKEASHRTVHRVDLPLAIFIKHYPLSDLRAYFRQAVRVPKARGEAEKALTLAARGVPTIEPLAIGETARGESWLITRGLENVHQLNHLIERTFPVLSPTNQLRLRFTLANSLARFLSHLHETGVRHQDLHAGNILTRIDDIDHPDLFLIDLHAAHIGNPLDWPASRDNLIMLNRWFIQRSTRTDRQRFWQIYTAARNWHQEVDRARDLEAATWDSCLAFWRNRDRRCLGNNRYFYRQRAAGNVAWAVRDLSKETLRQLLTDPDAPFANLGSRILKHSRSSTVAELTLEISGQSRQVIYKRIMATKRTDPWMHLVRPTPALRSWINGHRLLESGLPTARPLAVIHRRRMGLTYECYLLTEKLPAAVELHKYVASLPDRGEIPSLLEQAARLIRALHDRQLAHRDLKAANILVSGSRLWFIDLVGVERWRRLPRSRRVQNLSRLHTSFHDHPWLSRTDKLRFLRIYLRWGLKGRGDWKQWWREIAEATTAKLAQNRQRGRAVS